MFGVVIVVWLFLTVPRVGLLCVIGVFPDNTHLLFLIYAYAIHVHVCMSWHITDVLVQRSRIIPFPNSWHMSLVSQCFCSFCSLVLVKA